MWEGWLLFLGFSRCGWWLVKFSTLFGILSKCILLIWACSGCSFRFCLIFGFIRSFTRYYNYITPTGIILYFITICNSIVMYNNVVIFSHNITIYNYFGFKFFFIFLFFFILFLFYLYFIYNFFLFYLFIFFIFILFLLLFFFYFSFILFYFYFIFI